jgi:CheY-like chemotaxis protein
MSAKPQAAKYDLAMVIDDTYVDMYITTRVVTKLNLCTKVLPFSCAKQALDYLRANAGNAEALPSLIFVDIYMPGMSGFEFMEVFSRLPATVLSHCRVFVVSSNFDQGDINRARSYPAVIDFVEKPLGREILEKV